MPLYVEERPRPGRLLLVLLALGAIIWFFFLEPGRPRPLPGEPDPDTLEGVVEIAQGGADHPGSLAAYWKAKLGGLEPPVPLKKPKGFVAYQVPEVPESVCPAEAFERNNAVYCGGDNTIAWDAAWFEELHRHFGSVAPLSVLAHEYGHHISDLLSDTNGTGARYSKQEELQADCFSGMYLRHANRALGLRNGQLLYEARTIYKSADPDPDEPWFAPGRHGSGIERLTATGVGFFGRSLGRCQRYQRYHDDRVAQVDQYPVAVGPEVGIDQLDGEHLRLTVPSGQKVDVAYLATDGGATPAAVLEGYLAELYSTDEGASDVLVRPLGDPEESGHVDGRQATQRYGVNLLRDGQRQRFHGVVQVVVLDDGGAIVLDAFEPGPARGADPESWPELERVLAEVQTGIWPEGQGG